MHRDGCPAGSDMQESQCPQCGSVLGAAERNCPRCGATGRVHIGPAATGAAGPEKRVTPAVDVAPPGDAEDARVGTVIAGKYRILRRLGQGGMGTVYVAWKESVGQEVGHEVAFKVFQGSAGHQPETARRFINEVKSYARISHPNALTLIDCGQHDDGILYICTDLFEGVELRQWLTERGRLPVEEALDVALQVADVLAKAHSLGIVHRDLKPANIMVRSGLHHGVHVKVIDFGIARLLLESDPRRTGKGLALGTLRYMAPEQLKGEDVDARTDIYALGLILFEMLTGTHPFGSDEKDSEEIALAQLTRTTPSLSAVAPDLRHPELDRIIQRATAKAPEDRHQSMEALAADLGRVNSSPQPPALPPVEEPVRRKGGDARPLLLAIALVCLVFAAVVYAVIQHQQEQARQAGCIGVELPVHTGNASLDEALGHLKREILHRTRLAECSREDLVASARRAEGARETPGPRIEGERTGVNVKGTVLLAAKQIGARYFVSAELTTEAQECLLVADFQVDQPRRLIDELADRMTVQLPSRAADGGLQEPRESGRHCIDHGAYEHYIAGLTELSAQNPEEAEKRLRRAVELQPSFARAYYQLAYMRRWQERDASEEIRDALTFKMYASEREVELLRAMQMERDDPQGAIERYTALIGRSAQGSEGDGGTLDVAALFLRGDLRYRRAYLDGQWREAIDDLAQVLAIDPFFDPAWRRLVRAAFLGMDERADEFARQYVERASDRDAALLTKGEVLLFKGQLQDAHAAFEEAVRASDSPRVLLRLAQAKLLLGEFHGAEEAYTRLRDHKDPAIQREAIEGLAWTSAARGRYEKALVHLEEVASLLEGDGAKALNHAQRALLRAIKSPDGSRAAVKELIDRGQRIGRPSQSFVQVAMRALIVSKQQHKVENLAAIPVWEPTTSTIVTPARQSPLAMIADLFEQEQHQQVIETIAQFRAKSRIERPEDVMWHVLLASRSELFLAQAHLKLGNIDEALRHCEQFLSDWADADQDLADRRTARQLLESMRDAAKRKKKGPNVMRSLN